MTTTIKTGKDIILEYQEDSHCHTMICNSNGKELYVASEINKWLFPKKTYFIPTGIKIWYPDNCIGVLTKCLWINPNLEIIPQLIASDGYVIVQVKNTGILPIKISEEEILASLHIVPKLECHVVKVKND